MSKNETKINSTSVTLRNHSNVKPFFEKAERFH